jgi:hypothetical protein
VFISKVRFTDKSDLETSTQVSISDNQTNASATMTTATSITQDDLSAMEHRITVRNEQQKKESDDALSTAISALSAMSESATEASQANFLANLDSRWGKQEIQIEQHNAQMQSTMNSMQEMMNAMKQFVEAATTPKHNHSNHSSTSKQSNYWSGSDPGSDPDRMNAMNEDSFDDSGYNDEFASAAEYDEEDPATEGTLVVHRRSKRKSVKSPDLSRESKTPGERGSAPERSRRSVRNNLENQYAPLAESEKNSLGGMS